MTRLTSAALAVLAAAILAPLATPALARTADPLADETRIVVRYGDLDLATPAGASEFRDRVDRAAVKVKGDVDPRDLAGVARLRAARAEARTTADQIIAAHQGPDFARATPARDKLAL